MNDKKIREIVDVIDDMVEDNAHIFETRWDGCVAIANSEKIVSELLKHYQIVDKDKVVLSRKKYEKLKRLSKDTNQIKSTALEGLYMSHSDIENIVAQSSKETAEKLLNELYYIARFYYGDSANILAWAKDKAIKLGIEIKEN